MCNKHFQPLCFDFTRFLLLEYVNVADVMDDIFTFIFLYFFSK